MRHRSIFLQLVNKNSVSMDEQPEDVDSSGMSTDTVVVSDHVVVTREETFHGLVRAALRDIDGNTTPVVNLDRTYAFPLKVPLIRGI